MTRERATLLPVLAFCACAAVACGRGEEPGAAAPAAAAETAAPSVTAEALVRQVRSYFSKRATEQAGWLRIKDPKTNVEVRLQVDRFHADLAPTGPDSWYVSGDMMSDRGFRYLLDFLVERRESGLEVTDVLIRRAEEDVRYEWVQDGEYWSRSRS